MNRDGPWIRFVGSKTAQVYGNEQAQSGQTHTGTKQT